MKAAFKNEESKKVELFRRILYSFQVLMVGIALPLLFLVGISDGNQKKTTETEVNETSNSIQLTSKPVVGLFIPRI